MTSREKALWLLAMSANLHPGSREYQALRAGYKALSKEPLLEETIDKMDINIVGLKARITRLQIEVDILKNRKGEKHG